MALRLPATPPLLPRNWPAILTGLREFREHLGGELTITLLRNIGEGVEVHEMDHELVMQSIDWLRAREGA